MQFQRIEIDCPGDVLDDIDELEGVSAVIDRRTLKGEGDSKRVVLLVGGGDRQKLLDAIQDRLESGDDWRIAVMPVDALMPMPDLEDNAEERVSREEIFNTVSSGVAASADFFILIAASAVVACVGLVNDSIAVIIGGMLIAPMLSPILALVLGTALGDRKLIVRATLAAASAIAIVFAVGLAAGLLFSPDPENSQMVSRTELRFSTLVLALASGVAAALAVIARETASLVGVMAATALVPPIAVAGLFAGIGEFSEAGAALALAVANLLCINLSGQAVFIWKGVRARSWYEREKAKQSVTISVAMLLVSLAAMVGGIWLTTR
ncbi:MAG: TIGR00341 family protein [Flavobacteriaceae bacterium]